MPRRVPMSALLFAALTAVAVTPAPTLSARQPGAPRHDMAESPLSLQVTGMPAAIRLGADFSFTLTVRNDGAAAVEIPASSRRALGRSRPPDLRAVVSLFPTDGRERPLIFAATVLAGARSVNGSIRTLSRNDSVALEITARLGFRPEEERRDLRPLLPREFAAGVRLAFLRPTDEGVWYSPAESTPFQIRIEPPAE